MLTGSGFGDDSFLAHSLSQQNLTHRVVDLVGAGVVEVFAFEINSGSAAVFGQSLSKVERVWATNKGRQQLVEIGQEFRILLSLFVLSGQFFQSVHERFGHESPAEFAKPTGHIRHLTCRFFSSRFGTHR